MSCWGGYSGRDAGADAVTTIRDMGVVQHVTSKRSNGLGSMVDGL